MSSRVARKRSRAEEEEQDLPPTKREPVQDDSEGVDGLASGSGNTQHGVDGHARDGQVSKEDGEFWFDDGTVILVARNVEFRVYKGVLAGLSSVFKALFAQQHPVRNVRMDGVPSFPCPVVQVSDSPEDLRHLLRACFSKRLGSLYEERNPSYHEISATIRLGDQYKIAELHSQSLKYLKNHFTNTFKSWLTLKNYLPPGWSASKAIGVVNLARLTGELSVLPSAFVACICAKTAAYSIAHGFAREDGSLERLSPSDLIVCFEGKSSLRAASITAVFRTFKPEVSPKCKTADACEEALRDVLVDLEENVDDLLNGSPFPSSETFIAKDGLGACPKCTAMVRERSWKERKDVWDRLPELLGVDVPGWKEAPPQPPQPPVGAT